MSRRTRLLVINSPGNPSGRVMSRSDLEAVGELCEECDAWLVSDEVYEYQCFDGRSHVMALSVPSLRRRAICVSSFGKAFGLTGWRLGHVVAAEPLAWAVHLAHQQMSYCSPGALQETAAAAWRDGERALTEQRVIAQARRDQLCGGLKDLGLKVGEVQGGWFCTLDIADLGFDDDIEFCETIIPEAGVAAAPMSVSWEGRRHGRHLVRLCFAKREQTIANFLERLERWCARRGLP